VARPAGIEPATLGLEGGCGPRVEALGRWLVLSGSCGRLWPPM